jgi:hypothetical protein
MKCSPIDALAGALETVLREHGLERACADANWLRNILADFSPQTPALNRVAALAAREGVTAWLKGAAPAASDAVVTQAVNQLASTHAIDQGIAHDAVSAWARALGMEYSGARPTSVPAVGVDERVARKIQKLLDDADDAVNSGNYAEAVERYEDVLTLDPGHESAPRLKAFAERRRDKARSGSPAPSPVSGPKSAKEKGKSPDPIAAAEQLRPTSAKDASDRDRWPLFNTTVPNTRDVLQGGPSTASGSVANDLRSRKAAPPQLPNTPTPRERQNLAIRRVRQLCSTFADDRVRTPWGIGFDTGKLTNALASYGQGASARSVVLFYDDTLFGGAREGFIITTKGVYWKNLFAPPETISFRNIRKVTSQASGWGGAKILVNDREISVCMNDKSGIVRLASEIIRIMAGLQETAAEDNDLCIGLD